MFCMDNINHFAFPMKSGDSEITTIIVSSMLPTYLREIPPVIVSVTHSQ